MCLHNNSGLWPAQDTIQRTENWLFHFLSVVFAYNAKPHSIMDYPAYRLMFGCKVATVYNSWLGLARYNNNYFLSKCAYVIEQGEFILTVHRHVSKHIMQSVNKTAFHMGSSASKIHFYCRIILMVELTCVMVSDHQDWNIYSFQPISGKVPMCIVSLWQFFNQKNSQGIADSMNQTPSTNLPICCPKRKLTTPNTPQLFINIVPGTKLQVNAVMQDSYWKEDSEPDLVIRLLISSIIGYPSWL